MQAQRTYRCPLCTAVTPSSHVTGCSFVGEPTASAYLVEHDEELGIWRVFMQTGDALNGSIVSRHDREEDARIEATYRNLPPLTAAQQRAIYKARTFGKWSPYGSGQHQLAERLEALGLIEHDRDTLARTGEVVTYTWYRLTPLGVRAMQDVDL